MIRFKKFLEEAKRDAYRAKRLLDYISYRWPEKTEQGDHDQIDNLGPQRKDRFEWKHPFGAVPGEDVNLNYSSFEKGDAKLMDVPVKDIVVRQKKVSSRVVKDKIDGKWGQDDPKWPYVMKYHNVYILFDGNHRLNVARLKGEKYLKCMVYDIEDHVNNRYNKKK